MSWLPATLTALGAVSLWVANRWHEARLEERNAWLERRRALCRDVTDLLADFATDLEEGLSALHNLVRDLPYWGQNGTGNGEARYQELSGAYCARAGRAAYSHYLKSWVRLAAKDYVIIWHHPDPQNPIYPYTDSVGWRSELQKSLRLLLAALELNLHNAHVGLIEAELDTCQANIARCDFAEDRRKIVKILREELRDRTTGATPRISDDFAEGLGMRPPDQLFESDLTAALRPIRVGIAAIRRSLSTTQNSNAC